MSARTRFSPVKDRASEGKESLLRWETSLKNFQKSIDACNEIASDCSKLLSSFERTVKPLKERSQQLHTQIKNSSLVVQEFDKVIEYQTVASKYSSSINFGPENGKSKEYLQIIEKITAAKDFLCQYAPESADIAKLDSLLSVAGDKLESDIQKRLLITSKALSPSLILQKIAFIDYYDDAVRKGDFSDVDFTKYENLLREHEDDKAEFEDLALVAKYLQNCDRKSFDFFNFYTEVRCGSVLQGLHGTKELFLKNLDNVTISDRLQEIQRSFSNRLNRTKTLSKSIMKEEPKTEESQMVTEEMFFYVNRMIAAMVFLAASEKRLISAIVDEENQTNALVSILTALLDKCATEIDGMIENSLKLCQRDDLLSFLAAITSILPVLKFMYMFRPQFDFLIKTTMIGARRKLNGLSESLESAVDSMVDSFKKKSKEVIEKSSPDSSANIHEHTSNTVSVLIGFIKYKDVFDYRFASTQKQPDNRRSLLFDAKVVNFPYFWDVFTTSLLSLQDQLKKFSENYTDNLTKCVFLLNNYDYVIQRLKTIDEQELGDDAHKISMVIGEYQIYIKVECEAFENCWLKTIAHLTDMKTEWSKNVAEFQYYGRNLTGKMKNQIKHTFEQFNGDVSTILEKISQLVHPQSELCEKLSNKVSAIVLPVYDLVYRSFKDVPFTTKTNKYIIYTKESLAETFNAMFEKDFTVSRHRPIKKTNYRRRKG